MKNVLDYFVTKENIEDVQRNLWKKLDEINLNLWNKLDEIQYKNEKTLFEQKLKEYNLLIRENTSDISVFYQVIVHKAYDIDIPDFSPQIILDLGANVGYASVFFAKKYPQAEIFALEPEKSNYDALIKNTSNYKQIHPLKGAIYSETKEMNVIDINLGEWGMIIGDNGDENSQKTKAYSMNDLLKLWNLENKFIDIVKIDIEGSEKELFEADTFWLNNVRVLFIETHDRMKKGCTKAVMKKLVDYDFDMSVIGDGLVFKNLKR